MKLNATSLCFLMLAVVGCREEVRTFKTLEDFRPRDALVVVNGKPYAKRQLDLDIQTRLALIRHRQPKLDEKREREALGQFQTTALFTMVESELARQKAARLGMKEDPGVRAAVESRYAKAFSPRGPKRESFDDVARALGDYEENFRRIVGEEVRSESYVRTIVSNTLDVSDAAVSNQLEIMRREDAQARATNAVIYATASNVWKQALGGYEFGKLADAYSEEPRKGANGIIRNAFGQPAECDANDFTAERQEDGTNPVWDRLSKLRTGEITPPFHTTDGLAIYKCVLYIEKSATTGHPAWIFSRILFHRALLYPEYTPDELRDEMTRQARQKAFSEYARALHKDAKIEFPNGIDYLPKRLKRAYWDLVPHPAPETNVVEKAKTNP